MKQFDINEINERAAIAQREVGVDPDACLFLAEVNGDKRTPLDIWAGGLQERKFIIPAEHGNTTRTRTWRKHDEVFHAYRVGALHPELVDLVVSSATATSGLLKKGWVPEAEELGSEIDFFLSDRSILWSHSIRFLVGTSMGHQMPMVSETLDVSKEVDRLKELQRAHFEGVYAVEPMFRAIEIDAGRV